jgi:hypothetical protein
MQLIGGARFELGNEVKIEVTRFWRLGVNQQTPATDVIADAQQPGDRICQKAGTKASPLVLGVDPEQGEQCDWLWVSARSLASSEGASSVPSCAVHHAS